MRFEERMPGLTNVDRYRAECSADEQAKEMALGQFNKIVEAGVLPLFHKTAELLQKTCAVQIRQQEHTAERPFVVSVAMIIAPRPGMHVRQLRPPYPKLDFCLRQKTLRAVIFTERRHPAKLQIEELDLVELNAEKLEECVHDFIVDVFL